MGTSTGRLQDPVVGRPTDYDFILNWLLKVTQDCIMNCSSEKISEQYSD